MGKESKLLDRLKKIKLSIDETYDVSMVLGKIINQIGDENISIPWTAEDLIIYGKKELANVQNGYKSKEWNDSWIVIASAHADPFILNNSSGEIFFARHGVKNWKPIIISKNAKDFFEILEDYVNIYFNMFSESILDSDYEVIDSFKIEVFKKIVKYLTPEEADNFLFALTG